MFVASLLTLFAVVYFVLASSQRKADRELVSAARREFAGEYKEAGIDEIEKLSAEKRSSSLFVRAAFLARFRRISALVVLPVMIVGVTGGAFLARRALRPIHELSGTVRAIIETGKIDARISTPNTAGELRELVVSFNQMLGRIDA